MDKYIQIKNAFEPHADADNAHAMSKYMRNLFEFYGIPTPVRKEIYKDFIKSEKKTKEIDWLFLDHCYEDNHREFQYLVYDYLLAMKQYVTFEDIDHIKYYITTKPWWDTTDFLCKVIGDVELRDARVKALMVEWSKGDNIWLRRSAIQHQLSLKEKTDTELLEAIITNCFGTEVFFINKAIGWALREYSKTDALWVKKFIKRNREQMSGLSIKEASKYID